MFWDGPLKFIPPSCSPACRCSSTLQTSLRFLSGQNSVITSTTQPPGPPLSQVEIRQAPLPPVHCQTEESHTFSVKSLSFSLLQFQSLSLSLHMSSLLLHLCLVLSSNAEFLFLLAFSLLFSLCRLSVISAVITSVL